MIDALRSESVRVAPLASTYWTLGLGLAFCGLVALGFGVDAREGDAGGAGDPCC
jgi:hypothetical protein